MCDGECNTPVDRISVVCSMNSRSFHIWEKPPREQYAKNIINKTFKMVHPADLNVGDNVLDLQCRHIGYEKVKKINKIYKLGEFYEIHFVGETTKSLPKFAYTCLFGLLIK